MQRRTEVIDGVLYRPSIYELDRGDVVDVWDDFQNLYPATIVLILSIPKHRVLVNNGQFQEWIPLSKVYRVI